jgi:hypothetical protein
MSGLASLPDEILKLVMQFVPLKERLTTCCLVNSKLHAAAVAATQELQLCYGTWTSAGDSKVAEQHYDHFFEWLLLHGRYLTCLHLTSFWRDWQPLQQLPCPNLLELEVCDCGELQLLTAGDRIGVSQCCTKLTSLVLVGADSISDFPSGAVLDCLSSLVHLQHLHLLTSGEGNDDHYIGGLGSATLPRLTLLTYLDVMCLSVENLLQLGLLVNLQDLHLFTNSAVAVGPGSVPGLSFPSSLTKLDLSLTWQDGLHAKVEAGILSLLPTGLQHMDITCPVDGPVDGPGSFLSGMARLQHLTELSLETKDGLNWPPLGPAFSALTASSKLCSLMIVEPKLPRGVWSYVFSATHKLPHLTSLCVNYNMGGIYWSDWGNPVLPSAWGAADVLGLVSSSPSLFAIDHMSLQHGAHVSELHKLTSLYQLNVSYGLGSIPDFEGSLKGLAALTRLRHLALSLDSQELTVACLLPLTNLTALTEFKCWPRLGSGWQVQLTSSTVSTSSPTVILITQHLLFGLPQFSLCLPQETIGAAMHVVLVQSKVAARAALLRTACVQRAPVWSDALCSRISLL